MTRRLAALILAARLSDPQTRVLSRPLRSAPLRFILELAAFLLVLMAAYGLLVATP